MIFDMWLCKVKQKYIWNQILEAEGTDEQKAGHPHNFCVTPLNETTGVLTGQKVMSILPEHFLSDCF